MRTTNFPVYTNSDRSRDLIRSVAPVLTRLTMMVSPQSLYEMSCISYASTFNTTYAGGLHHLPISMRIDVRQHIQQLIRLKVVRAPPEQVDNALYRYRVYGTRATFILHRIAETMRDLINIREEVEEYLNSYLHFVNWKIVVLEAIGSSGHDYRQPLQSIIERDGLFSSTILRMFYCYEETTYAVTITIKDGSDHLPQICYES